MVNPPEGPTLTECLNTEKEQLWVRYHKEIWKPVRSNGADGNEPFLFLFYSVRFVLRAKIIQKDDSHTTGIFYMQYWLQKRSFAHHLRVMTRIICLRQMAFVIDLSLNFPYNQDITECEEMRV